MVLFFDPMIGTWSLDAPFPGSVPYRFPVNLRTHSVLAQFQDGHYAALPAALAAPRRLLRYALIGSNEWIVPPQPGVLVLPDSVRLPEIGYFGDVGFRDGADKKRRLTGRLAGPCVGDIGIDQVRIRTKSGGVRTIPKTHVAPTYYRMDEALSGTILSILSNRERIQMLQDIEFQDIDTVIHSYGTRPEILAAGLWRHTFPKGCSHIQTNITIPAPLPLAPRAHRSHKVVSGNGMCRDCGLFDLSEKCVPWKGK